VAAIAPHPTRLGVGVLKWERSILSLTSIVSQPLFSRAAVAAATAARGGEGARARAGSGGGGGGGGGGEPFLFFHDRAAADDLNFAPQGEKAGEGARTPSPRGKRGGLFSRLFRRNSADGSGGGGGGGGEGGGAADASSAAAAALEASPAALASTFAGVGVLLSFGPESPATLPLLRTVRAARRPAALEGWLLKRKRSTWRGAAPLGPLAWKRRWFVLEPTQIV
jgi:hypothetical protein